MKEEKFIDDERYVRAYVSDKFKFNKWGKTKIRYYLKGKGLSDKTINIGLEVIDDEQYKIALIKTMKEKDILQTLYVESSKTMYLTVQKLKSLIGLEKSIVENYCDGNNFERTLFLIDLFKPFPDIYWFLWSLIQLNISKIEFDYYNYGKVKYENAVKNLEFIQETYGVAV